MMAARHYAMVLSRRETQQLTLSGLAEHAGMHPGLVQQLVDCGLIEPSGWNGAQMLFDPAAVLRLRLIARLRESLSVNLAGVEVILHLLDRFEALQRENERLRSRL
jgi:DNA-binding transcriptional MerR regulator